MLRSIRMTLYPCFLCVQFFQPNKIFQANKIFAAEKSDFYPFLLLNCVSCVYIIYIYIHKLKLSKDQSVFVLGAKRPFSEGYF